MLNVGQLRRQGTWPLQGVSAH